MKKNRMDSYQKQRGRVIRKQRMKDFCMILLFLFLLPYTFSLLFVKDRSITNIDNGIKKEAYDVSVILNKTFGTEEIPLEEYLIGTCASTIQGEAEMETIKAQSVILRSVCFSTLTEKDGTLKPAVTYKINQEKTGLKYLNVAQRRQLWKENNQEYEDKFSDAVAQTEGIVILYEDKIVSPPYFRLSNGKTRTNNKMLYLKQADCKNDQADSEFLHKKTVSDRSFWQGIEALTKQEQKGQTNQEQTNQGQKNQEQTNQEQTDQVQTNQEQTNQRKKSDQEEKEEISLMLDSAGYVEQVVLGGTTVSGEAFRDYFELPSLSYEISQTDNQIILLSKGIGHGFGFSQSQANALAKKGEDYLSLLQFFFQKIDIQKIV